jgi:DNA-binding MarR family transcriptional regulator
MTPDTDFDLQSFLPYLLNRAAEETGLKFQKIYKDRYGMLRTEWRVLAHLGGYGTMTATEIGARAGVHKTKISRAVARLELLGFLARSGNQTDRRQEFLGLTKKGQAAYADLSQSAQRFNAELTRSLSEHDQAVLTRCLTSLAAG